MQGLNFVIMKRKGKFLNCKSEILSGSKSVVLGSYTNEHRYCVKCFITKIEQEFNAEILDFISKESFNGV